MPPSFGRRDSLARPVTLPSGRERLYAQHYPGVFKTHTFGIIDVIDVIRVNISRYGRSNRLALT